MSVGKKYVTKDDLEAFARKLLRRLMGVNVGSQGASPGTGGASSFTELDDVPPSYAGDAEKFVRVNAGETGLEFSPINFEDLANVLVGSGLADGDVPTWDAGLGMWVPLPPSGGSGGGGGAPDDALYIVGAADAGLANARVKQALYLNYDLCDYPASPDAMDDEFDDGALDGKWTKQNEPAAPNALSESAFAGMIWFGLPENANDNWATNFRIYQTPPAGNQTLGFIARVAVACSAYGASWGQWGGVGIYIGDPTGKDAVIAYGGYASPQPLAIAWGYSIDNDTRAAATNVLNPQFPVGQFFWIKLQKDTADAYTSANNYTTWASADGIIWHATGYIGAFTFSNAPTQLGLWTRFPATQTGTPVVQVLVDSFRRID